MKHEYFESIVNLYQYIGKLKQLKRSGWLDFKVENPESVADHTFGMALLVMIFAQRLGYDLEKCMTMALVHDLAEAVVGDITPRQGINSQEKLDMEVAALGKILEGQHDKERLIALWREVVHGSTPEGRLVKDLDKLEMALQAYHYEKDQGIDLQEFFNHCQATIREEEFLKILDFIIGKREKK